MVITFDRGIFSLCQVNILQVSVADGRTFFPALFLPGEGGIAYTKRACVKWANPSVQGYAVIEPGNESG